MWSQSRRAYTYSTDDAIVLVSLDADTLMHWAWAGLLSQSIVAWAPMGVLSLYLYTLPCLWWPLCTGKGEDIMAFLDCQLDYTEEDID